MNEIRIVKSGADAKHCESPDGKWHGVYLLGDTISVQSQWTAEELAVLAGMDKKEWDTVYWKWLGSYINRDKTFYDFIREYIQNKISNSL